MKMDRGLIILLARNTLAYTRECLKTLLAQSVPVDILVVDNASTDGTGKLLVSVAAKHRNVYRWTTNHVESVAGAWNHALNWGWERGHQEALVVNSDTELLPGTYEVLKGHMDANRHGMVTAVGVDRQPAYPGDGIVERLHPDYSCYMLVRWAHKRVPFDQRYEGAYFEDCDHHIRMVRAGIWAGSINLEFRHHSSGTLKLASLDEQKRIAACYDQNKRRFQGAYGCLPGTKGYEALFLAAQQGPSDAKGPKQPDAEDQDHHHIQNSLDRGGHRNVGVDEVDHHAHDHQDH